MANGVPSWSESLDTQLSVALDVYSGRPANLITKSGEKFLNTLKSRGRVIGVKDSERVRHPLLIGGHGATNHGETTYYEPDDMDGTPADNNLGTTAEEILTWSMYNLWPGTRNINMPQSMPAGDLLDYASTLVRANMMSIFNEEEKLFWTGTKSGDGTDPKAKVPFQYDDNYGETTLNHVSTPTPMSALALFTEGTAFEATNFPGDDNFAGVDTSSAIPDLSDFRPQKVTAQGDNSTYLLSDLEKGLLIGGFSEVERVTNWFTTQGVFETILKELRALGALTDPVRANLGTEGTIPFGGTTIDWSRYLAESANWDTTNSSQAAVYPILGFNMNSIRMNLVLTSSPIDGKLGFVQNTAPVLPHPSGTGATNLFKRIQWKRGYSLDNGRRSFVMVDGYSSGGTGMA